MMHGFLYLVVTFAIVADKGAQCYNLDASNGAATIVHANVSKSKDNSAYAGYQIMATVNQSEISLILGAPKYSTGNGAVIKCRADITSPLGGNVTTDWTSDFNCTVEMNGTVEVSDSNNYVPDTGLLGSVLLPGETDDEYLVCAPGQQEKCFQSTYQPGACYHKGTGSTESVSLELKACPVQLDLIFVVDSSNSISSDDFEVMRKVMLEALDSFNENLGNQVQIAVLQYGDAFKRGPNYASNDRFHYRQPLSFGQCLSLNCVKEKIQNMTHIKASNTYTALAIERAVKLDFANSINKVTSEKKLVLITDGASTDYDKLARSYELTKKSNITVYVIGVGNKPVLWQLRQSANGNKNDDRVSTANDFVASGEILKQLTAEFSALAAEGLGQSPIGERIQYSLFGFSGHHSNESKTSFIGAVGAYDSTGSVITIDSANSSMKNMLKYSKTTIHVENSNASLYLGYSLACGYFTGNREEYLAVGAPRHKMCGAVYIYKVEQNGTFSDPLCIVANWHSKPERSHRQVGSYFGGSVLSTDLNGDGRDDLLIGAPLYVGSQIDEGRVFVYLSQEGDTLMTWTNESFKPLELSGGNDFCGRFGEKMAAVGDLNNDGYNDVAISAPFADHHRGVVYIYHGSASGVVIVPEQKITASEMNIPVLNGLGLSLEGGKDLDGNLYPDLILGAPASDSVVILRSRPLARFNTTIRFTTSTIDTLQCYVTQICAQVEVCLCYDGKSVDDQLDVEYNITVDARLEFTSSTLQFDKHKTRLVDEISEKQYLCKNFSLRINLDVHGSDLSSEKTVQLLNVFQTETRDFVTPLNAILEHRLTESHLAKPLSTIEEKNNTKKVSANAIFTGIGIDQTVRVNVMLPTLDNQSATTLMKDNRTLVIASNDSMVVRINLTNAGDTAFGTRVYVTYSKELSWGELRPISSSNGYRNCMNDRQDERSLGVLKTRSLVYVQGTLNKDVMPRGAWCFFEVTFSTVTLKDSGNKPNVNISFLAESKFEDKSKKRNHSDNSATLEYAVKYRADADLRKKSFEHNLVFNFTDNTTFSVSSVDEIGGTTSSLFIEHEVKGKGYSVIPHSSISVNFPSKLSNTFDEQRLLYLYKLDCVATGGVTCSCNQSTVNPLQLDSATNGMKNKTYTIAPNPNDVNQDAFNCSSASNKVGVICERATCSVKNLGSSDVVSFKASFRLWRQTLNLNFSQVSFTTETSYSTAGSPLVIDNQGRSPTILTYQTVTIARKYVEPEPGPEWWPYALASIGGLLIFLIIGFIMYKKGFFRRKYKEQLEIEKNPQWNNPDAPDNTYENQEL